MKYIITILLIIFPTLVFADSKITDLTQDNSPSRDNVTIEVINPSSGSSASRKVTLGAIADLAIVSSSVNWGSVGGVITAQNWQSLSPYLNTGAINWSSLVNSEIQRSGVNWIDANIYVTSATGNVGVGSVNPVQKLDVNGTVNAQAFISTGTGTNNFGSNVGIGSVNPTKALDVNGTVKATAFIGNGSGLTGLPGSGTVTSSNINTVARFNATGTAVQGSSILFDNSTNIGIGSLNPTSKLDVSGTITALGFTGNGSGNNYLAGNVGIGSVNPTKALDVVGTVKATAFIGDGSGLTGISGSGTVTSSAINTVARFNAAGTTVQGSGILFDTSTNVGIGTAGPSSLLDVNRKFNVFSGGNIGIGSVLPGSILDVQGAARFYGTSDSNPFVVSGDPGLIWFNNTDSNAGARNWAFRLDNVVFGDFAIDQSTTKGGAPTPSGNVRFYIKNDGNVGIGNTTPGQPLDVSGTIRSTQLVVSGIATDATHTDSTVCQDTTTHQFYAGSGTIGICLGTSSARYKNSIVDMHEGLEQILQLSPKNFFYNKDAGDYGAKLQYGLLAEDVVKVIPGLVGLDDSGKPNSVDLLGMVPILINGEKKLQDEIDELKIRIEILENKK